MGELEQSIESARRSWQAALEHLECGDFKTAGALFRATGRYVERIGEESQTTTGVVVQLPSPTRHREGLGLARVLG